MVSQTLHRNNKSCCNAAMRVKQCKRTVRFRLCTPTMWALLQRLSQKHEVIGPHSPHDSWTAVLGRGAVRCNAHQLEKRGTKRTYAGAAVADAALVRTRGAFIAVSQLMSPYRSIRGPDCAWAKTELSPYASPIWKMVGQRYRSRNSS